MLAILEKVAIVYSLVTLFAIELLYQIILVTIKGTQYSLKTLKNTVIDTFFELLSDLIMLMIDFIQSLLEGFATGWNKALNISSEFRRDVRQ